MSSSLKSFVFAFLMCVSVGLLLTLASQGLSERQAQNVKVDQQKNILQALGYMKKTDRWDKDKVMAVYTDRVNDKFVSETGELANTGFPIHIVTDEAGGVSKYAIPFKAYGLWSWIHGYIAIEGDASTVAGLSVYKHGETPGLGGECEKPWFVDQFVGKRIRDNAGEFKSVGIVKGKVEEKITASKQIYYVDGMSGATITGDGMARDLKTTLKQYEPFAKNLSVIKLGSLL